MAVFALIAIASARSVAAAEPARVTIHADQKGPEINPFIYGQFIEHLGRCIYGGIWAEMLEDRKFYFPITEDYDPYKSLQDTAFPVVGASPWQIIGDPENLVMVKEASFVGDHTPRIRPGAGIRQRDLGRRQRQAIRRLHLAQVSEADRAARSKSRWSGATSRRSVRPTRSRPSPKSIRNTTSRSPREQPRMSPCWKSA